jgi:4-amino-4-deoxy-L-arabinose transferase-like glycosyltransferase
MFIARPRPDGEARIGRPRSLGRRLAAPLLLVAAALLLRAPGFGSAVLDPDEGLYVVQAAAWLRGHWPYIAVWDMHPPGAPALLALVQALVPDPVLALRLAGALAVGATALLLRDTARILGAGPGTALAAGLLYVAHTLVAGGLATNTELLFAPFVALAARLLLAEALRPAAPRVAIVLIAGLSAGVALWVKQVTALESSALWFTLVCVALAARRMRVPRLLPLAVAFALGAGLPSLGMAFGYWLTGHWADWLQGNILAPLAYVGAPDEAPGLRRGLAAALPPFSGLLLATAGLAFADETGRRAARLLLPWLAAAVVAMAAPGKYFDHYFLVLLPPLSLLAAFGLSAVVRRAVRPAVQRPASVVLLALLVSIPVMAMALPRLAHGIGLRGQDPVRAVARAAAAELAPGEAMFVANWHVMTYALAGRTPPTRFAFPIHLMGVHPGLTGQDMMAELDRVLAIPPAVIVVAPDRWRLIRPEARSRVETAIAAGYRLVATIPDAWGPVEVWRRR